YREPLWLDERQWAHGDDSHAAAGGIAVAALPRPVPAHVQRRECPGAARLPVRDDLPAAAGRRPNYRAADGRGRDDRPATWLSGGGRATLPASRNPDHRRRGQGGSRADRAAALLRARG